MSSQSVQVRVTSIRSRGKTGGIIFSGVAQDGTQYVVVCGYKLVPDASLVDKGQHWAVHGRASLREAVGRNGYRITETQIQADAAELLRPSGRNIIAWIAECPDCTGIGQVKASKLYDRFGPGLIELIEQSNVGALSEILTEEAAHTLCNAFRKHRVANTLLWLDQVGIPRRIGASVVAFYKEMAQTRIEANPYVLISFDAKWVAVDDLAQKRFGVQKDDTRRLEAAIEESLYRCLKNGHTCLPEKELRTYLYQLLGSALTKKALAPKAESSQYRRVDGYYQPTGTFLIESYLAQRFQEMVAGEQATGQMPLFASLKMGCGSIQQLITDYEQFHGITLSEEQRQAVVTTAGARLSLILGGAGTGKTTVLKAVYAVLDTIQPGVPVYQLALAGRAAQRMTEATGRDSMTIAAFLSRIAPSQIDSNSVVVVDEVSMVDVILMYRLLRHLPPGVRLILVGDPAQLPPIGPGLVLHALAGLPTIPQVELKVVKRQSDASGIPHVAAAIRAHQPPAWEEHSGQIGRGVSFVPCAPARLQETVQAIYQELGGDGSDYSVQVLSVTNTGAGGVQSINASLHTLYQRDAEQIYCYEPEFGVVGATTLDRAPLKVGDLVTYTENDYQLGLRNGSLGKILEALPVNEADDPCCLCDFEGAVVALGTQQLHALRHSYSITVHKSQGSQFNRVIVPIRQSRLLDQTLIYTAVTRGVEQVVLVGDEPAVLDAIAAPASAARRHVTLPRLLKEAAFTRT